MTQIKVLKVYLNLLLIASFIVFNSCKDNATIDRSDTSKSNKNSLKLLEKKAITFTLDQETNYNISTKLNTIKDKTYLSFFNPNNFSIYIYNYDSKSLYKRIQLDRDGPNGIKLGGRLQPSYFIHTLDSIFLTGSLNHYLVDENGKILVDGSINNNTRSMISSEDLSLSFDKATYFNNGNIYSGITSYSPSKGDTHLRAIISLPFDSVSHTFLRKDVLIQNYDEVTKIKAKLLKEDHLMAVMGLSYARNGPYLYASTPISHTVYIFKDEKLINKVYTGTDEIRIPDASAFFDQFRQKTYLKAMENPFYKGLFSDISDNRNFLYRIVSKGNSIVYNEDTKQDEQISKGGYLIVIDLNTNTTTYLELPTEHIDLNSCFITNGKIHFKLKIQDNENKMTFKTFSVE